jgi:N-acetylmuramoyl-L-alanine amidase/Putative peptidoglycan binding domain
MHGSSQSEGETLNEIRYRQQARSTPQSARMPNFPMGARGHRSGCRCASCQGVRGSQYTDPWMQVAPATQASEFVRWVQSAVGRALGSRLPITGVMDATTRQAVRQFQRLERLPEDGIVGPPTQNALQRRESGTSNEWEFESEIGGPAPQARGATDSPLAVIKGKMRSGRARNLPVAGICVHTTGGGPAKKASSKRTALDLAHDFYVNGSEGFPHYVIDYDGRIVQTCKESQVSWHAGWAKLGGIKRWQTWTAPQWWQQVWVPKGISSPAQLMSNGARDPNSVFIGIELLADKSGYGFTDAQYNALARLVRDIAQRHNLTITGAPSRQLLGHEDVDPISRQNKDGGWDPGAHRNNPQFSWARLWTLVSSGQSTPNFVMDGLVRPLVQTAQAVAGSLGQLLPSASPKVPTGFKVVTRNGQARGLARYGGARVDATLKALRDQGVLNITDADIDTLQRIANVESGGNLQALNTWDSAVVSIGFMQWTLRYGELQRWIRAAAPHFKRYGIELDPTRTYTWKGKSYPAIKGADNPNELRWGPWAERFYQAGLDLQIVAIEGALAIQHLERTLQALRGKNRLNAAEFALFKRFYCQSLYLRGLYQEAHNNRPAYSIRAAKAAAGQAVAQGATDAKAFVELYKTALLNAYAQKNETEKARRLIQKTSQGARA